MTIYIPQYSITKFLYWYEKLIGNYVEVQLMNKKGYRLKEVLYMYFSHLDFEAHQVTKDNIRAIYYTILIR